jgi:hypothetical protein
MSGVLLGIFVNHALGVLGLAGLSGLALDLATYRRSPKSEEINYNRTPDV